jgi:N utilization substance protein A
VKNIVRELNNEKVDIIRWSSDVKELVMEALKPAKLKSVTLNEAKKVVEVRVDNDQLSLAIGKRGQNARLTARLCGWEINIEEDMSAKKAFDDSLSGAEKQLVSGLGVSDEVAHKLVGVGMNAVEVIADVSAQDIVDATGLELAAAEEIVNKAKSASVASQ